MNGPESQDVDSDSQDNYQGDVNDQEHIEFDPPVTLQHLTCEMEWLRQTVQDKDNDPRDAVVTGASTYKALYYWVPIQTSIPSS